MIPELEGKLDEIRKTVINGLFPMLPGDMKLSEAGKLIHIFIAAYEIGYADALSHQTEGSQS